MSDTDVEQFIKMFDCDTARISNPLGSKMFLSIGWKRNTKQDLGRWLKNGEPIDFDYVREKVIASGATEAELIESANEYKRLLGMTIEDYLSEIAAASKTAPAPDSGPGKGILRENNNG